MHPGQLQMIKEVNNLMFVKLGESDYIALNSWMQSQILNNENNSNILISNTLSCH